MANFRLTLIAPTEFEVEAFGADGDIWTETDVAKTVSDRYTSDPDRASVMRIKGITWDLDDGYTLNDGLYLDDSVLGKQEGAYKDFNVTAEVTYSISFLYKVEVGTLTIILYDYTHSANISSESLINVSWSAYEKSIEIPTGCTTLRVKLLQSNVAHSSPFYIDNFSINGNAIIKDPDTYRRTPERIGSYHQAISGKRYFDLKAIHYLLRLGWNYFDATQYDNLREIFFENEMLYFDDTDVPSLVETGTLYDNDVYDYTSITNPSSTHKAYKDSSSSLPSAESDFQTSEYTTANYQAIDDDDENYVETTNPTVGYYLYHKFCIKSAIATASVQRLRVKVVSLSDDTSSYNNDGCILYAWDGTNWVELTRTSNADKTDLTWSTADSTVAQRFVDSDTYVRLLLRSYGTMQTTYALSLRTYFVEVEVNEDLDEVIELTHKAILDANSDVISVKNTTDGTTLTLTTHYTIAADRRSVTVIGQTAGDEIEVTYNRYFEVMFDSIPEEWIQGDGTSRRVEITLRTLSQST